MLCVLEIRFGWGRLTTVMRVRRRGRTDKHGSVSQTPVTAVYVGVPSLIGHDPITKGPVVLANANSSWTKPFREETGWSLCTALASLLRPV